MKRKISLSLFLLFLLFQPLTHADTMIKVAVLPFRVHSEENLDYMREGIADMLASRIAIEDRVVVLEGAKVKKALSRMEESPNEEDEMKEVFLQLGADYILSGSITKVGENLSIDARMFNMREEKPGPFFFATIEGMDNVIPEIGAFALKAKVQITGQGYPDKEAQVLPVSAQASDFMSEFLVSKKEKANGILPGQASDVLTSSASPLKKGEVWESQELDIKIKGIRVGDVNLDGKNETVVLGENSVSIYTYSEDGLELLEKVQGEKKDDYIFLDIADINDNGVPEIFVTNLKNGKLNSFVLEFKENEFKRIAKEINFFMKVIHPSKGQPVLLGQEIKKDSGFGNSVMELVWGNNIYRKEKKVPIPLHTRLYGFDMIDVDGDGDIESLSIDSDGHLKIFSDKGDEKWKGLEVYEGPYPFVMKDQGSLDTSDETESLKSRGHIQNKIVAYNPKGGAEVLVIKNSAGAGEEMPANEGSEISSLKWNGTGLSEIWRTEKIQGDIVDFQVKDINNDGKDDLVIGVNKEKSIVKVYDLME